MYNKILAFYGTFLVRTENSSSHITKMKLLIKILIHKSKENYIINTFFINIVTFIANIHLQEKIAAKYLHIILYFFLFY